MTTSALAALRASVVAAPDPNAKAEALAKVGVCLAQLGQIEEARNILVELRENYSSGRVPRILIRAMILEGIIAYYADLVDSSDRVHRAHALARACGSNDLSAEASVWKAHLAFNFERYAELRAALADAVLGLSDLDDSYRARICLIVADSLQYLADRAAANDWYTLARIFARRIHDHALMTAIEYNRLGIGLSRIRVDRALGELIRVPQHRDWLLELGSVKRLHLGFSSKALTELLDLCDAYTNEICGDFESAIASLERILTSGAAARCGVSDALLRLELEWCRSKVIDAKVSVPSILANFHEIESLPINEQLIALAFFRDLSQEFGVLPDKDWYDQIYYDALRHFEETSTSMLVAIETGRNSIQQVRRFALSRAEGEGEGL